MVKWKTIKRQRVFSTPDMQKDKFFTQTWFDPKIFYPKKCVNYDKSSLRQNSIKGPKSQIVQKKMPKSNIKFQIVKKCYQKSAKLRHYSLSQQNSVKFNKDFTTYRIFLHQHCWHVGAFLHLCCRVGWPSATPHVGWPSGLRPLAKPNPTVWSLACSLRLWSALRADWESFSIVSGLQPWW